jgi:hypothetical protein
MNKMSEEPFTTEQAIDVGLTKHELDRAISKTNSSLPDSIGDQLFRMSLNLSFSFYNKPKEDTLKLLQDAKDLLQTYKSMP